MVKNSLANAGNRKDVGLISGSGRSLGGEHGNPLQYSCLGNPMERGAWRDTVHKFAESDATEVTEHARMSSWGLPAVYWASVTHRHLSALSPVKDSSL